MKEIQTLLKIMSDLRDPQTGCPWDIKQSFASIAPYTVEEAYEVADAIERDDIEDLKSELGDLLFQVVFHSQIAAEQDKFDFADVVQSINEKLVRRHPHVFSDEEIDDEEALAVRWEQHKKKERDNRRELHPDGSRAGYLDGITSTMPALRWSDKLQKRAASYGFDWESIGPVIDKLDEEVGELKAEINVADNAHRITDEMGDVLFASVNLARHLGVNPEQALRNSNRKFIARFQAVEQLLIENSEEMADCTVEKLESYWQVAKKLTAGQQ